MTPMTRSARRSKAGWTALVAAAMHAVTLVTVHVCAPASATADAPWSTFFSAASMAPGNSYSTDGGGDLWPSAWSNDDKVYTLNGDGWGFGVWPTDIKANVITSGDPSNQNMTGAALATNISQVWTAGDYNRKPTGIISVAGVLYAAVQDLSFDFNVAPAATIVKSTDHAASFTWNTAAPMFSGGVFTTIWFCDFGKDNVNAPDNYVYAYGLDNNWRGQQKLYLARVLKTSIMTRSAWEFFTGDLNGNASWSSNIALKTPVLSQTAAPNRTLDIGQGGAVFNAVYGRYILSTWGGAANMLNLFEAPAPWGPFKQFLAYDAGPFDANGAWPEERNGGYGTSIPSKYVSTDGKTMWLQANNWEPIIQYFYSFRKVLLNPTNLMADPGFEHQTDSFFVQNPWSASGWTGIDIGLGYAHSGSNNAFVRNDTGWNSVSQFVAVKPHTSYVYSVWVRASSNNTSGVIKVSSPGTFGPAVGLGTTTFGSLPNYTLKSVTFNSGNHTTVNVTQGLTANGDTWAQFDDTILSAGGSAADTSTAINDGGFENTTSAAITTTPSSAWYKQGTVSIVGATAARTGMQAALLSGTSSSTNAIKQLVSVTPGASYTLSAWVKTSSNNNAGSLVVRAGAGGAVMSQTQFAAYGSYTLVSTTFNSGSRSSVEVSVSMIARSTTTSVWVDDMLIQ
jgi:hypothetical protein